MILDVLCCRKQVLSDVVVICIACLEERPILVVRIGLDMVAITKDLRQMEVIHHKM